jgi:hypothetical protein
MGGHNGGTKSLGRSVKIDRDHRKGTHESRSGMFLNNRADSSIIHQSILSKLRPLCLLKPLNPSVLPIIMHKKRIIKKRPNASSSSGSTTYWLGRFRRQTSKATTHQLARAREDACLALRPSKTILLQTWYGLSDCGIEAQANNTFSLMCFRRLPFRR